MKGEGEVNGSRRSYKMMEKSDRGYSVSFSSLSLLSVSFEASNSFAYYVEKEGDFSLPLQLFFSLAGRPAICWWSCYLEEKAEFCIQGVQSFDVRAPTDYLDEFTYPGQRLRPPHTSVYE